MSLSIGVVCFSSFGGSGVMGAELAVGLAHHGHRVHLLASAPPSRPLPPCPRLTFTQVPVPTYPMLEHAPYDLALASAMVEVAEGSGLDVLHVHYAVPHAVSAYLARQILGDRAPVVIVSLHGTDVTHVGVDPAYGPPTRFAVAQADGVTVPSAFLQREARAQLDVPESLDVEIVSNFVNTDIFAPPAQRDPRRFDVLFRDGHGGGPVLFHVSNFRPVKRVPDLVEVLARLRQQVPARLVLVGDGPERDATWQRARNLGVEGSVCFLGKRGDFAEDLRHADVFVLPSESESFGVAALEALASGVPVCAYRVGGLPEVVSREVGRLVPPFDIPRLADAILEVTLDPATQAALGKAARAHVLASFRREPIIKQYEAHYQRVLGRRRKAS